MPAGCQSAQVAGRVDPSGERGLHWIHRFWSSQWHTGICHGLHSGRGECGVR